MASTSKSTEDTPTKKTAAKKSAATKKAAATRSTTKKAPTKKSAAKKSAAKTTMKKTAAKTTTKKTAAKTTPAKKTPAKKTAAKKTATTKTTAKKAPAKKAPAKAAAAPATRSRKKAKRPFAVGDKVVHPHHGAATVKKVVKREVNGEKQDYYQLEIATDQLTVYVPVENAAETIRPVISKAAAGRVLKIFKEEPQEAGANWSRWYKVLNEKMTSGDINQVAEVIRDLSYAQQTKGISPALKRMLSKARVTLISELAFALKIDEEEAERKLDRAIPKVEPIEKK